jgi:hypothetical protein
MPRTNYMPACNAETYRNRIPNVSWDIDEKHFTNYYRLISRFMLAQPNERTLISCIVPRQVGHINTCLSIVFKTTTKMVNIAGAFMSVPYDFFVKSTGRGAIPGLISSLPVINFHSGIVLRALMLNCLTRQYEDLWSECWQEVFARENWLKSDSRLDKGKFANLTAKWQKNSALRSDYERRQGLLEIDVLTSMLLDLTLDELCTIYRIQFPVLRQNENDTWYDQNGRIVFTCSKGLPGVGFSRPEWNEIKDIKSGAVSRTIIDDTMPGGPRERAITYVAPFDKCDREKDYEIAWKEFERRLKEGT